MIKRIAVVVGICLVLTAGLVYSQRRTGPLKVSGFVESDEIRIGSRVGGRVKAVLVEEGDEIKRDQELVQLEPYQLFEQLAQARAELAEDQAESSRLETGYLPEEKAQSQARLDQLGA